MPSNSLNLTDKEIIARDLFLKIYSAYDQPIDVGHGDNLKCDIPEWFDELKFKRGQMFFSRNQFATVVSHLLGSVAFLAEPAVLNIIRMTNKSNTVETARQRYVEALLHTTTWYGHDLKRDSASWNSLNRVRRLHLNAAQQAMRSDVGVISQAEVSMGLYIFVGLTIGRPHNIGVAPADVEGREGFIHFWAVIGYMLGLDDQYNYCLQDMEIVEIIIGIFTRYFFIPNMQIETNNFNDSTTAFCEGLNYFFRDVTYPSILFLTRRALGVPGYQYSVDTKHLKIMKDIFTQDEISQLLKYTSRNKHYQAFSDIYLPHQPYVLLKVNSDRKLEFNERFLTKKERIELGFSKGAAVIKRTVPYDQWSSAFNDSQFHKLSTRDQGIVKKHCSIIKYSGWFIVKWITFIMSKYTEHCLWSWHSKTSIVPLYYRFML